MNKFDIIKILSKKKGLTEKDSKIIIATIIDEITQALRFGDRVEFRGFGVFYVKKREERTARNPKTGEKIVTDKKNIPYFKMSKILYEYINQ
ncbi:MAG: integration host factor subunit beta [Rhodobacteraceae bacterium]|nr:integration host factor subunit beta [Paracoccaceae bacterium]